ncbi:EpsG family protein [Sphingomonas aliaeris]|uniref:EpsG family protein n=1 Tax=Sphingomonas aliaeris TaxID=2759526 RepID=UPI00384C2EEE
MREKFVVPDFQKSFWTVSAFASVLLVAALAASAASSGVDRMSLYFIPLQFFVYCRLPYIFGQDDKALPSVLLGVIAYCVLIQFVWLNYADNANYWMPYQLNV